MIWATGPSSCFSFKTNRILYPVFNNLIERGFCGRLNELINRQLFIYRSRATPRAFLDQILNEIRAASVMQVDIIEKKM